jgi:hypothetical protein
MGKLEYRVRRYSPKAWQLGEGTIVYITIEFHFKIHGIRRLLDEKIVVGYKKKLGQMRPVD